MVSSTFPVVKAALVDALTALQATTLADVDVIYGIARDWGREAILVTDTTDADQEWAALGHLSREEAYSIGLVVDVENPGASQREATERAFELLAIVETALRTDPQMGINPASIGARMLIVEVKPRTVIEGPAGDEGYAATIRAVAAVKARI